MELTKIAVEGSPNPHLRVRLELGRASAPGRPLQLALLHDEERPGQYARVYRGRIGAGPLALPVAVKLQHEHLGQISDFKFGSERYHYLGFETDRSAHPGRDRVIRMIEFWPPEGEARTDVVPPCVVCEHAEHALPALCPECRQPMAGLDRSALGMRCSLGCNRDWTVEEVMSASLSGPDRVGCGGCSLRPAGADACRPHATLLTRLARRVLVLELMDLDLGDYLKWSRTGPPANVRADAVAAFSRHQEHEKASVREAVGDDPGLAQLERLRRRLTLFLDVLRGAEYLHAKEVVHRDLKTANIGCRFAADQIEIKILDFGLADDPAHPAALRAPALLAGADPDAETALFAAPEMMPAEAPAPATHSVRVRLNGRLAEFDWPLPVAQDDAVRPNDRVTIASPDTSRAYTVTEVIRMNSGTVRVLAVKTGRESSPHMGRGTVTITPTPGKAADLFSLGMVLLDLLATQAQLLSEFRDRLPRLAKRLHAGNAGDRPARAAVACLGASDLALVAGVRAAVPAEPTARDIADQLFGIVLRATTRGIPDFSYARHRGDPDGLRELRREIRRVCRVLDAMLTQARRHGPFRQRRLKTLERLALHLDAAGPAPVGAGSAVVPYDPVRLAQCIDFFRADSDLDDPTNRAEFAGLVAMFPNTAELRKHIELLTADTSRSAEGAIPEYRTRALFRTLRLFSVRRGNAVEQLLWGEPSGDRSRPECGDWVNRFHAFDAARDRLLSFSRDVRQTLLPLLKPDGRARVPNAVAARLLAEHPLAALSGSCEELHRFGADTRRPCAILRQHADGRRDDFRRLLGPTSAEFEVIDELLTGVTADYEAQYAGWLDDLTLAADNLAQIVAWYDERVCRPLAAPCGRLRAVASSVWRLFTGRPPSRTLRWDADDRTRLSDDLAEAAHHLRRLTFGPVAETLAEVATGGFDYPEHLFDLPIELDA